MELRMTDWQRRDQHRDYLNWPTLQGVSEGVWKGDWSALIVVNS